MPSAAKILSLKPDVCKIDIEAYEAAVLDERADEGLAGTKDYLVLAHALGRYQFIFRIGRTPRLVREACEVSDRIYAELSSFDRPIHGDVVARLRLRPDRPLTARGDQLIVQEVLKRVGYRVSE